MKKPTVKNFAPKILKAFATWRNGARDLEVLEAEAPTTKPDFTDFVAADLEEAAFYQWHICSNA